LEPVEITVQVQGTSGSGREIDGLARVTDLARTAAQGTNGRAGQLPVLPLHVHLKRAARAQTAHTAGTPRVGKRGQKVDASEMALEEHFGNPGGRAEVPIDLEWRIAVEKVWVKVGRDDVAQEQQRMIAVVKPRPETHAPRHAPLRAAITAGLQHLARGRGEDRRAFHAELVTGIKRE